MHLFFDAATAVVSASSSPERAVEVFRRSQGLFARDGSCRYRVARFGVCSGRQDGKHPTFGTGIAALARVISAGGCDNSDVQFGGNLGQPFGQHVRAAYISACDLDGADRQRCLLIPKRILRQSRYLALPCLRPFHSPSPSIVVSVLPIRRCRGPRARQCGMLTARIVLRRLSVMKSGTSQPQNDQTKLALDEALYLS